MALPAVFLDRPIAHRGLHNDALGIAENSAAAFIAAIDHGYCIELDLQLTKDGQAVVFHDNVLDRMTGQTGLVNRKTAKELAEIRLGNSRDTIKTLAEILDLIAGRAPVLCELKDQDGALGPNIGTLEEAVTKAFIKTTGPVALMSFNPYSVECLAKLLPQIPRGLTTSLMQSENWDHLPPKWRASLADIDHFDRSGACFVSHRADNLDTPRIRELKRQNIPVLTWTTKTKAQENAALKFADNITFEGYLP